MEGYWEGRSALVTSESESLPTQQIVFVTRDAQDEISGLILTTFVAQKPPVVRTAPLVNNAATSRFVRLAIRQNAMVRMSARVSAGIKDA